MESEIKDLMYHVLQRLDKLQQQQDIQQQRMSQLDHVIERFDTVQNVIETQNQKHQLVSEKLDQINLILKEQLRYAHSDILVGINVLHSKLCDAGVGSSLSQSAGKVQMSGGKNYVEPQFQEIIKDFHGRLDNLDKKVETMYSLLTESTQSSCKLTELSQQMETRLQHMASNIELELGIQQETVNQQKEIQKLQDRIKTQTRADLAWLEKKMDLALSDVSAKVNEKLEMVSTKLTELNNKSGHVHNALCEQQKVLQTVCSKTEVLEKKWSGVQTADDKNVQQSVAVCVSSLNTKETTKSFQTTRHGQLPGSVASTNEDLKTELKDFSDTIKREVVSKIQVSQTEIEKSVNQSVFLLKQHLDSSQSSFKSEIHSSINKGLLDSSKEMKDLIEDSNKRSQRDLEIGSATIINEVKGSIKQQVMELVDKMKDHMDDVKFEIFAINEKESQLVRDYIESNVQLLRKPKYLKEIYTFDLFVQNFKSLIRSGKTVRGAPWHIRKFKSSVQGQVDFTISGEMVVWLTLFRHPLEVGLQPRFVDNMTVKAQIIDIKRQDLQDVDIGEKTWASNEEAIVDIGNWGVKIGKLSCDDLVQNGYGEKEGYSDGAILVRYIITVL